MVRPKSKGWRTWLAGVLGAALAVLLGLALDYFPAGQALVNRSYDFLFAPRANIAADEARMVYMDEESYTELKQPLNAPWDRALHAKLLDYLRSDHARAVAFDIVFSDPGPEPAADEQFARAIQANGRVVLAADVVQSGIGRDGVAMKSITMPDVQFRGTNVTIGSAEVSPDEDLVIRRHLRTLPDDELASLSWATAQSVGAAVTRKEKPYERERWINYYGPPLTLPNVSYYRIFSPEGLPPGYFSNKVVFVGAHIFTKFAGERKDEYSTPYSYWLAENRFIPGVEAQATECLNLLRGDFIVRASHEIAWLVLLGVLFGFGLAQLRPLAASGMALLGAAATAVVSYYLFSRQHVLFAWLLVVAVQIPVALFWSVIFNSIQLYVQNRLYEQSLKMYLPPKLVKKFAHNKKMLKPGAEKQVLTLLFSDIADFTSISEGMDPDELAALMNEYFQAAVGSCVHRTDGTIVKYIGDAIFAFWNAPEHQADHALRACEAALRFHELNERPVRGRVLRTRIGLHTGVVNVGNFGSEERVDYTALGENVNLASRLEGLNKFLGTDCLISGQTKAELGERLLTRALGSFRLKGFEALVAVHEIVGWPEQAQETRAWREAFAEALANYEQRNLELAAMGFRQVLELRPNDGPSQFYLNQIAERSKETLTDNWATHTVLREK